ncbi:MAG: hypothetical protein ACRD6W_12635, partial [Nitrososphaerales archaeon]
IIAFSLELVDFVLTGDGPLFRGNLTSTKAIVGLYVDFTLAGFIALSASSVPRFLPGARSIRIDDEGVKLF